MEQHGEIGEKERVHSPGNQELRNGNVSWQHSIKWNDKESNRGVPYSDFSSTEQATDTNIIVDNLELDYFGHDDKDKKLMMLPTLVRSRYVNNINVTISMNPGSNGGGLFGGRASFLGWLT